MSWHEELQMLAEAGLEIAPGLTEHQLGRVEAAVHAKLPPDLRRFLSEGLPLGKSFPDWRYPGSDTIQGQLDWPFEGIAFDIERNGFWMDAWGLRPEELASAIGIARVNVAAAPRLIPIFGHRYMPAQPELPGNPILSVYQTDIIYYGRDLASYLRCEFGHLDYASASDGPIREVPFWSDLVAANS